MGLSTVEREPKAEIAGPTAAARPPPLPVAIAALSRSGGPVWVFGYGSLIWEPVFAHDEAEPALLRGYHRAFCLYSFDYRGTPAAPGLVLGLDRGGSCHGIAFRLARQGIAGSLERLWRREMTVPPVYDLRQLPIRAKHTRQTALAFTVRRDRPDYAGRLSLDDAARLIARAQGRLGSCRDYLDKTLAHLAARGIVDRPLRCLAERVAAVSPEVVVPARDKRPV